MDELRPAEAAPQALLISSVDNTSLPPSTPLQTPTSSPLTSSRARSTRTRKQRRTYSPSPRETATPNSTRKASRLSRPSAKQKKRDDQASRLSVQHDHLSHQGIDQDQGSAPNTRVRPANYLESPPAHLFVMQRQHRPELWRFMRLAAAPKFWHLSPNFKNEHAAFAYCTRCHVSVPFKTSNYQVLPHMENFHRKELYGASSKRGRRLDADFADAAGELREISSQEQAEVNKLLAKWIAGHFRPLVMIEDQGFIDFILYITRVLGHVNVPLPKRTQLRGCIIALAAELREHVTQEISKSCVYFSITADIWTTRNGHSYISFTIHYVDEDFNPRNWTLEVKEIPGRHSGELIAEFLEEIMCNWKLNKERSTRLVRDSGANMVSCGNILGIEHVSCLAHDIHLVLSGAMSKDKNRSSAEKSSPWSQIAAAEPDLIEIENEEDESLSEEERAEMNRLRGAAMHEMDEFLESTLSSLQKGDMEMVREAVQKFRTQAVYFRRSPKAHNRLDVVQADNLRVPSSSVVNMIVDCPTRWNSCYLMMERCIRLEPALAEFFTYFCSALGRHEFADIQKKLSMPKYKDWLTIKCLYALLKPFAIVSTQLGGQLYPTLPLVLPALCGLKASLENRNIFDKTIRPVEEEEYAAETRVEMDECRKVLLTLFTTRFAKRMKDEPKWIAFLDPRVAGQMSHLNSTEKQQAIEDLISAAATLSGERIPTQQAASASTLPDDDFMTTYLFGKRHRKSSTTSVTDKCRLEVKKYLAETDAEASDDEDAIQNPFDWWRGNKHKYRYLSQLARKWLGTVATSVASERAFSTSGNIVTVRRCSLAPELVRDLVFIADNSRRIEQQQTSDRTRNQKLGASAQEQH